MVFPTDLPASAFFERRTEPRNLFTVTMDYSTDSRTNGAQKGKAVSTNLSSSGLGFLTGRCFQKGQSVTLLSKQLSSKPVTAVVRWCDLRARGLYKVGLSLP